MASMAFSVNDSPLDEVRTGDGTPFAVDDGYEKTMHFRDCLRDDDNLCIMDRCIRSYTHTYSSSDLLIFT